MLRTRSTKMVFGTNSLWHRQEQDLEGDYGDLRAQINMSDNEGYRT